MWLIFCSLLSSWMHQRFFQFFPRNFIKLFCQTIASWRFVITTTFHQKNHLFTHFIIRNFFFLSWLKVVSEISLRNSLYACFVFLSFLWNKLSKNLSNSSQISTKLSISLLFISHLLTVTCVAFVFSRFRTNLFDFSPSSYHWQLLHILMYSAILS